MIIWIASYPKSGNTWVRLFLKAYFTPMDEKFNINTNNTDIFKSPKFPSPKFLKELNINHEILSEVAKNWITLQDKINLNNQINYLKTHNAMCTINNHKFTNVENTLGAIYLVRDPRDIISSYASHLGEPLGKVYEAMINSKNCEERIFENKKYTETFLGSWSDHYNSWKSYKFANLLFIKYEDLISAPEKTFLKILTYLNHINKTQINEKKMVHAINLTSFENLKKQEGQAGFVEGSKKGVFFREGKVGMWKKNINKEMVQKIERSFFKEMKELNYL